MNNEVDRKRQQSCVISVGKSPATAKENSACCKKQRMYKVKFPQREVVDFYGKVRDNQEAYIIDSRR